MSYSKRQNTHIKFQPHKLVSCRNWLANKNDHQQYMRYQARIRQLQDDLYQISSSNQELQNSNEQLTFGISQIKAMMDRHDDIITALKEQIIYQAQMKSNIKHYQSQVLSMGEQLQHLHNCSFQQKDRYDVIRNEKKQQQLKKARLMQKLKETQQNVRQIVKQIYVLINGNQTQNKNNTQIYQSAQDLLEYMSSLQNQTNSRQQAFQKLQKELSQVLAVEKQKKIAIQYRVRLLKQREKDLNKNKSYLQDQMTGQMIQNTIAEMKSKRNHIQNAIRHTKINNRQMLSTNFAQIKKYKQKVQAEKQKRLENRKQYMEQVSELQKILKELRDQHQVVDQKLTRFYDSGVEPHDYIQSTDGLIFQEIKQTDAENVLLQQQLKKLLEEMQRTEAGIF